jgi:hypothetical protein
MDIFVPFRVFCGQTPLAQLFVAEAGESGGTEVACIAAERCELDFHRIAEWL